MIPIELGPTLDAANPGFVRRASDQESGGGRVASSKCDVPWNGDFARDSMPNEVRHSIIRATPTDDEARHMSAGTKRTAGTWGCLVLLFAPCGCSSLSLST